MLHVRLYVCGPAPLLGCRRIRVRVSPESIYVTFLYAIDNEFQFPIWYQLAKFCFSNSTFAAPRSSLLGVATIPAAGPPLPPPQLLPFLPHASQDRSKHPLSPWRCCLHGGAQAPPCSPIVSQTHEHMGASTAVGSLSVVAFSVDQQPLLNGAGGCRSAHRRYGLLHQPGRPPLPLPAAAALQAAATTLAGFPPTGLLPGADLFVGTCVPDNTVAVVGGLLPGDLQLRRAETPAARAASSPYCARCDLPRRVFCSGAPAASVPHLSRLAAPLSFKLFPSPASTPLCQTRCGLLPGWTCPAAHPFFIATTVGCDPSLSRPSWLDLSSLWPNRRLHG
jgi:hypothetical protein